MSRSFKTIKDNRTNYIYYGVGGGKTILIPGEDGITEAIIETLHNFDDDDFDNNRRETSKHNSIDDINDKSESIVDQNIDVEGQVFSELENEVIKKMVLKAVSDLKPQQRDLIYALYLSDKPIPQAEYAKSLGITESSVCQKAWRARIHLKQIIESIKK